MATAQSILIDAVRRIAGIEPDALALLKEIQRRGGIDGIKTQLGGDGGLGENQRTAGSEDCCTDPGDPPRPWNPPWGGGGDDPATDCETGQPLQFTPGGFPRPETCKGDCKNPDPTWQGGYYWHVTNFNRCNTAGATPQEALVRHYITTGGGDYVPYNVGGVDSTDDEGMPTSYFLINKNNGSVAGSRAFRVPCPGLAGCNYCTDEAPIISDCQDWEPDNTTSYTLANGCIVASSCDTDASEQAKQCNDCITVCAGDKEVRICGTLDGGYSVTDMDTGSTTLYSASGVPR